jgi:hypothetical protein
MVSWVVYSIFSILYFFFTSFSYVFDEQEMFQLQTSKVMHTLAEIINKKKMTEHRILKEQCDVKHKHNIGFPMFLVAKNENSTWSDRRWT